MEEGLTIFGKTVFDTLFIDWKIMVVTALVSIILFIIGVYILLDKWGRGIPEGQTKPAGAFGAFKLIVGNIFEKGIGHALEVLILDVGFQRRTFRRRKLEWFMHIMIFWGWVGLFVLTVAAAVAEFYGPFILNEQPGHPEFFIGFWKSLELPNNIFGVMLGVGISIAVLRRLFVRSKDVQARNADVDWILLIGLGIIVITGFIAQAIRGEIPRELSVNYGTTLFNNNIVLFHEVFTLLFGVAYIPFSKYLHIFTAPLTILANHGGE